MPFRKTETASASSPIITFDAGPARTVSFAIHDKTNCATVDYAVAFAPNGEPDEPFFHDATLANSAGTITIPAAGGAKYLIFDQLPEERVQLTFTNFTKTDSGGDAAEIDIRIASRP